MRNHSGDIKTSERLQLALSLLKDGQWHTTLEIARAARTEAAGATITDLRCNGFDIETRYAGRSAEGRKVYQYRLVKDILLARTALSPDSGKARQEGFFDTFHGRAVIKCP